MASPFNSRRHSHRRAALVLVCALSLPVSTPAQATMDDMFGVMFRMMMVMMNVMSDAMLGNNNSWGNTWGNNLGGLNSFNMGMSAWPMMSGFGSPWNSIGSPMGMSPWNSYGRNPRGMSPWRSGSRYPGSPYGGPYGPSQATSLLEGRWFGNSGEILVIRGNRFMLQAGGTRLGGILRIENNIVNLYSPQTNTVTRYTFMRNQSELLLSSGSGTVLTFRKHPADSAVHQY